MFIVYGFSRFKIVFILLAKIIIFYIQIFIIEVKVFSLKRFIARRKVYLAMFLVLKNNFRANLVTFYKSIFVYKPNKSKVRAKAKTGMRA